MTFMAFIFVQSFFLSYALWQPHILRAIPPILQECDAGVWQPGPFFSPPCLFFTTSNFLIMPFRISGWWMVSSEALLLSQRPQAYGAFKVFLANGLLSLFC